MFENSGSHNFVRWRWRSGMKRYTTPDPRIPYRSKTQRQRGAVSVQPRCGRSGTDICAERGRVPGHHSDAGCRGRGVQWATEVRRAGQSHGHHITGRAAPHPSLLRQRAPASDSQHCYRSVNSSASCQAGNFSRYSFSALIDSSASMRVA